MNVCVITPVLDAYKGGNHLPLFAACSDIQFTILCNRSKVDAADLPVNVTVVTVPGRIGFYYYGVLDFLFARSVMKAFPSDDIFWRQFAVIHLNQVVGPAFTKLLRSTVPVLLLIHHPVTADREVAMQETCGFTRLFWWCKYFFLVRWQRCMCNAVTRVATVSCTMKERISTEYCCAPEKISIVSNGVDGDVFTASKDATCKNDVIAIGSFVHPRKGFSYLLKVYKELSSKGISIADVGRRTDEQVVALQSIQGVTVYGTVDADVLVDLLRHTRVLVSTSLYEGFGLSLIEALACGHPAFAFDVGAVPEVLIEIDPSLISPARDTEHMVKNIVAYIALTPEQRDGNSAKYRTAVLQRYSHNESAKSLQNLYQEIQS